MHVVCDSSKCSLMSVSNLGKTVNREKAWISTFSYSQNIHLHPLSLSLNSVYTYIHTSMYPRPSLEIEATLWPVFPQSPPVVWSRSPSYSHGKH